MSSWIYFVMSMGFLLILMSTTMENGSLTLVGGFALVIISLLLILRNMKNKKKG